MGMATGIMPVIGIPLPLLSYGGSSLLTTMMALGLVLNVSMRRHVVRAQLTGGRRRGAGPVA